MKRTIGMGVGALILAALAAAGGFFYGTTVGEARANSARDAFLQERAAEGGQFDHAGGGFEAGGGQFQHEGGQGQGNPARARGTGEVTGIEGDTLTLTTAEGEIQVLVNGDTVLRKVTTLTLDEVQPGEQIVVFGDRDPQGNLVARSIQVGVDFRQDHQ